MGTLEYALVPRGRKRLKLLFTGPWETAVVELDGATIWTMERKSQLDRGHRLRLADGSELLLKLVQAYGTTELHVTRDGVPLPGSPSDPSRRANQASHLILAFALITALLALATELSDLDVVSEISLGWPSLGIAAAYALLGALTMRRSKPALLLAIGLFILDSAAVVFLGEEDIGPAAIGVLFLRALLVIPLLRGVPAVEALARHRRVGAARAAADAAAEARRAASEEGA
ncbi:MAG: hypothetical protein ABI193_18515, partial [Minicystis sp.]